MQSAFRVGGHTTLHHPRLCLDTSYREKIRKARQFQTWRFGNDHSTFTLLSLLLRIVQDAGVIGCEPRAPMPFLFVKQKRLNKNEFFMVPARRVRVHPSLAHLQNPSWVHLEKNLCCRGAHAQEKFPRIRTTFGRAQQRSPTCF